MYRLTNLTLDTTTNYQNKDLVYQALERENAKVKHQDAEAMVLVEELDKKGVVIYQEEIYLPFDGIADSLFLKPGMDFISETTPKTGTFPFLKSSGKTSDQKLSREEKQEFRESLSDTPTQAIRKKRTFSLLKVLWQGMILTGLGASLAMAGVTTNLAFKQEKALSSLSQQVRQLENLQAETGKLDAFIRYFLPRYYSEQGQLDDFVESSIKLNNQTGQLQSVILETSSQTADKIYQMTYVLSIREGENRSQKRLTVSVKKVSSALYGYQVVAEPELEHYPN